MGLRKIGTVLRDLASPRSLPSDPTLQLLFSSGGFPSALRHLTFVPISQPVFPELSRHFLISEYRLPLLAPPPQQRIPTLKVAFQSHHHFLEGIN